MYNNVQTFHAYIDDDDDDDDDDNNNNFYSDNVTEKNRARLLT